MSLKTAVQAMARAFGALSLASLALTFAGCGAGAPEAYEDNPVEDVAQMEEGLTITENGWAWVLATGALGHGYRSTAGSITSSRYATGRYRIDLPGVVNPNRHVVAYGNSNASCQLVGGATGSYANVDCYSPSGARQDSAFVFAFDKRAASAWSPSAYLSSTAAGYAAPIYAWNSSGGTNTVTWDAVAKEYTATLPGLTFHNASVHVTANYPSARRCKVRYWVTGLVRIRCTDLAGNPVQSMFDLAYNHMTLHNGRVGGHSWVQNGAPSSSYSAAQASVSCFAPGSFSAAPSGADLTVTLSEPYYPPSSWTRYFPMVTAYGSSSHYCNVRSWSSGSYSTNVRCFDTAGVQVPTSSTAFTLTFTDNAWPGPC